MKVIVSEGSGPAQPLQAREWVAPGGLGWVEGGSDGRVWGDPDERGDLKEKQRGLGGKAKAQIRQKVQRTPAPAANPIPRAL